MLLSGIHVLFCPSSPWYLHRFWVTKDVGCFERWISQRTLNEPWSDYFSRQGLHTCWLRVLLVLSYTLSPSIFSNKNELAGLYHNISVHWEITAAESMRFSSFSISCSVRSCSAVFEVQGARPRCIAVEWRSPSHSLHFSGILQSLAKWEFDAQHLKHKLFSSRSEVLHSSMGIRSESSALYKGLLWIRQVFVWLFIFSPFSAQDFSEVVVTVLCADMKPFDTASEGFSYLGVVVLLVDSLKLRSFRVLAWQQTNCVKKKNGGKDTLYSSLYLDPMETHFSCRLCSNLSAIGLIPWAVSR